MAAKRSSQTKKTNRKNRTGLLTVIKRAFQRLLLVSLILSLTLTGLYVYGPPAAREQIGHFLTTVLDGLRHEEWVPEPLADIIDKAHDAISHREGLLIDAGELGYDASPLLAGLPISVAPVRVLRSDSVINLFDETNRMTRCIALRLTNPDQKPQTANAQAEPLTVDPRVPNLRTGHMTDGPWSAQPLLPAEWVASSMSNESLQELRQPTFSVPMRGQFYEDYWSQLMQKVALEYPKKFGEIWVYTGPVLQTASKRLASGIPVPDYYYAIVFDITSAGWLRSIAFLIPHQNPPEAIGECITSIQAIESLTGLRFLPALNKDAYADLSIWVNPYLW
ncbi:MAG: hypothetical protein CNE95_02860 [Puniceicoccaceae bacterium MED-G30]|nr:MAG: hypothetical protein CNE95_02860 [Puniceicoccaceae bacterium MED-G30]